MMRRGFLKEYRASDWKISELDPDTSGKYVFDFMDYEPHSHCDNCGHRNIAWKCHIYDAENPEKKFVVGDDCIEFLLAISGGLENPKDLERFRQGKKELLKLFNRLRMIGTDTKTLDGVLAVGTRDTIDFYAGDFSKTPVKHVELIRRVYAPGMMLKDWIHFFPNIKKILVYSGVPLYETHNLLNKFKSLNSKLRNAINDLPSRLSSKNLEGWEVDEVDADAICPELGLGKIKVARVHSYRYSPYRSRYTVLDNIQALLPDGHEYDLTAAEYGHTYGDLAHMTTKALQFNTGMTPAFPEECVIDVEALKKPVAELDPKSLVKNYCSDGSRLQKSIETVERRQAEEAERERAAEEAKAAEEERKRKEAEAAAAEETRKIGKRGDYFNAMAEDSQGVVDGMKGQCIAASWLERVGSKLNELIGQKIKDAYGAEADATEISSATPLKFTVNNCTSNFRLSFKPQVDRLKGMDEGARIGYLTNILAKNAREGRGKPTAWNATLDNGATVKYSFKPTGMKDAGPDAVIVVGKVDVEINPVIAESLKKMKLNENQKITLTIGQIKRLLKEYRLDQGFLISTYDEPVEDDKSKNLETAIDLMTDDQVEEWNSKCESENAVADSDKLSIALDILTDRQVDEYQEITGDY